jgi:anti-sigma28 factor (negative regulator of flagellin synthesis)
MRGVDCGEELIVAKDSNRPIEPERLEARRARRSTGSRGANQPSADPDGRPPIEFGEAAQVTRTRRVEELRDAVERGKYQADPQRTAESMLENERT